VEAFAEGYRYELGALSIDSVIVEPGPVKTELLEKSATPADEDLTASYGPMATMPTEVEGAFSGFMVENADTAADPMQVVNDVSKLIAMPFGTRPLRTVSGADFGVRAFNDAVESIQADLLEALGIAHLDPNNDAGKG